MDHSADHGGDGNARVIHANARLRRTVMAAKADSRSVRGRNAAVDFAFNRPGVFSADQCNSLISWAEASGGLATVDVRAPPIEKRPNVRRHRQLDISRATKNRVVTEFRRELSRWVAALNERLWRFHITRMCEFWVVRYERGDQLGQHIDLTEEYSDRKLVGLVQLSPPGTCEGGVLSYGLAGLPASVAQGALLVFPAWVPHRVTPVTRGVRYAAVFSALGPSFR
jgi:PKHD-type hydroxylase